MTASKEFTFSGHDTFSLRHGWLKKVFDQAENLSPYSGKTREIVEPKQLFDLETAMLTFGVGKNMVRAMRYWALASGILKQADKNIYESTDLGKLLFSDREGEGTPGLDPYLENLASIWLIHWLIVTNTTVCTAWDFVFSHYARTNFSKGDLIKALEARKEDMGWKVSRSSIEKDITCLLQMYSVSTVGVSRTFKEDMLDSPFTELGLISRDAETGGYRFEIGRQPSLANHVLYFAIVDYANKRGTNLLSLDEIFFEPGSPGRIFKLDEISLCSLLEQAELETDGLLKWQETGPLRQLRVSRGTDPLKILRRAYNLEKSLNAA